MRSARPPSNHDMFRMLLLLHLHVPVEEVQLVINSVSDCLRKPLLVTELKFGCLLMRLLVTVLEEDCMPVCLPVIEVTCNSA